MPTELKALGEQHLSLALTLAIKQQASASSSAKPVTLATLKPKESSTVITVISGRQEQ
jgi:hypothetical protein